LDIGHYVTSSGFTFSITRSDNALRVAAKGQAPVDLTAESQMRFHAEGLNTAFVFNVDAKGEAMALIVQQEGRETRAKRSSGQPAPD
jgi:hypothetical protein